MLSQKLTQPSSKGVERNPKKRLIAKHTDVPVGITLSYSTFVDGAYVFTDTPAFTNRGNPTGRYGTWLGQKFIAVHFGNNRTQNEALQSILAYKVNEIYPPKAYYNPKTAELLKFDSEIEYQNYLNSIKPNFVAIHLYLSKGARAYSKSGLRLGHFTALNGSSQNKYYFGTQRNPREALINLVSKEMEEFTDHSIRYIFDSKEYVIHEPDHHNIALMVARLTSLAVDNPMVGVFVRTGQVIQPWPPVTPFERNQEGSIYGAIRVEGRSKSVSVDFGKDLSKESALTEFLAYKNAGVSPPMAYYCHKESKLIYSRGSDRANKKVKAPSSEVMSIRLVSGVKSIETKMHLTSDNKPMGYLYLNNKRFGFGRRRNLSGAFQNLMTFALGKKVKYLESKIDDQSCRYSTSDKQQLQILLQSLVEHLKSELKQHRPDFIFEESAALNAIKVVNQSKERQIKKVPQLELRVGALRNGKTQYHTLKNDPLGSVLIMKKRITFGANRSLTAALNIAINTARKKGELTIEFMQNDKTKKFDINNSSQCILMVNQLKSQLKSELESVC
ncbi:hypothetical protein OH460_08020 [Vibrio sp. Makdt]|uniref:hypothetical protein n=1 Tax=Vibrio sp. Makdt TaxID=2998828 RepID=UPI0022CD6C11|nr:hypothetical protein [Vibrio sp. Makdt]MDA0152244.1 hypothetical protein [Vibrio sp. Makdt]